MGNAMPCQHEHDDSIIQGVEDGSGDIHWICPLCQAYIDCTPALDCELDGMQIQSYPVAASDPWTEH